MVDPWCLFSVTVDQWTTPVQLNYLHKYQSDNNKNNTNGLTVISGIDLYIICWSKFNISIA